MKNIPEVLQEMKTPLALAGLALLLGAGILREILKKKPNPILQSMVRWGFVLALTLGILATVSYLVVESFHREIRVTGRVCDESNNGLAGATVSMVGGDTTTSLADGEVSINIPASRRASKYELNISLAGFKPGSATLSGPQPEQFQVKLAREDLNVASLIRLPESFVIGTITGAPLLMIQLRFHNPLKNEIQFREITATVESPKGERTVVPITGYVAGNVSYVPSHPPLPRLASGEDFPVNISCSQTDTNSTDLIVQATNELGISPGDRYKGPKRVSPELVQKLVNFATARSIWTAGEWKLVIGVTLGEETHERVFHFRLTESQVHELMDLTETYAKGGFYRMLELTLRE